jgi:hypothetical protein
MHYYHFNLLPPNYCIVAISKTCLKNQKTTQHANIEHNERYSKLFSNVGFYSQIVGFEANNNMHQIP